MASKRTTCRLCRRSRKPAPPDRWVRVREVVGWVIRLGPAVAAVIAAVNGDGPS